MKRRHCSLLILLLLTLFTRWAVAIPASACDHSQHPAAETVSDAALDTTSHSHHGHHHPEQEPVSVANADANHHDCCDTADCCSDPQHSCDGRCGCAGASQLTVVLFSHSERALSQPQDPGDESAILSRLPGYSLPLLRPPISSFS